MTRTQLLACVCMGAVMTPAVAASFDFVQLTETPFGYGMFEPSISSDGTRVAFSATYDFTGGNSENNFEIYVYDVLDGTFLQLTDTPWGYGNFLPMITPDGQYVVFRAAYDYTGENPDGLFELFEVEVATGIVRQITDNPAGVSVFEPAMSGDGTWVAYRMFGDPLGTNPENNFEIFRVNRLTLAVEQVTITPSLTNEEPSVNYDGSRIVFTSRTDFDGSNPNGNIEIWMWDEMLGVFAVTATPIPQYSDAPSVDGIGRYVAFRSRYDFTGENPTGTQEIYVADVLNATFAQVTVPASLLHLEPVVSPDGTFLIFESQRNPTGENPDQNREIFHYDIATDILTQLTVTTGGVSIPQLSDRAEINYAAIAADVPAFSIRNEHPLDPEQPNDGGNLELFLALGPITGDMDCDGDVDFDDINPFVLALSGEAGYEAAYPDCQWLNGDTDGDGDVDFDDINGFVGLIGG